MPRSVTGKHRKMERLVFVIVDSFILVACFLIAMALRLESIAFVSNPKIWAAQLPAVGITIVVFYWLGLYRWGINVTTGKAFGALFVAALVSAITLSIAALVLSAPIPIAVPIIYAALLILAAGGIRYIVPRIMYEPFLSNQQAVAIYGSDKVGQQLCDLLKRSQKYVPLAFIDDSPGQQSAQKVGLRVYASKEIRRLVDTLPIKSIILAKPSASRASRHAIVSKFVSLGLEVKTIPSTEESSVNGPSFSDIRFVRPQEIFGSPPMSPRDVLMRQNITGRVVLVSGAGGAMGSELCRQIVDYDPAALILLELLEAPLAKTAKELRDALANAGKSFPILAVLGSVQDAARVSAIMQSHRPDTIYHAAAYKDVALLEANVAEGIHNNVFGTKVLAEAASSSGVKNFILVSTDLAMAPRNVMAASQRTAELICQALAMQPQLTVFSSVRVGNVLPSSGSIISRIEEEVDHGGPVYIKHPENRQFFMTSSEAAQLVIQAGAISVGGEVHVVDLGESISELEIAKTIIKVRGRVPAIEGRKIPHGVNQRLISIKTKGLGNGEYIYDGLLYGNDPVGTEHPRILKATEAFLPLEELQRLLVRLGLACTRLDLAEIEATLAEPPISFSPLDGIACDIIGSSATNQKRRLGFPKLRIVDTD